MGVKLYEGCWGVAELGIDGPMRPSTCDCGVCKLHKWVGGASNYTDEGLAGGDGDSRENIIAVFDSKAAAARIAALENKEKEA